jgi:hypothetical protein
MGYSLVASILSKKKSEEASARVGNILGLLTNINDQCLWAIRRSKNSLNNGIHPKAILDK